MEIVITQKPWLSAQLFTWALPPSCRAFFIGLGNGCVPRVELSCSHHSLAWSLPPFPLPLAGSTSSGSLPGAILTMVLGVASSNPVVPDHRQALDSPQGHTEALGPTSPVPSLQWAQG